MAMQFLFGQPFTASSSSTKRRRRSAITACGSRSASSSRSPTRRCCAPASRCTSCSASWAAAWSATWPSSGRSASGSARHRPSSRARSLFFFYRNFRLLLVSMDRWQVGNFREQIPRPFRTVRWSPYFFLHTDTFLIHNDSHVTRRWCSSNKIVRSTPRPIERVCTLFVNTRPNQERVLPSWFSLRIDTTIRATIN